MFAWCGLGLSRLTPPWILFLYFFFVFLLTIAAPILFGRRHSGKIQTDIPRDKATNGHSSPRYVLGDMRRADFVLPAPADGRVS